MKPIKLIIEKLFFLGLIAAVLASFWYFEESLLLKVLSVVFVVVGILTTFRQSEDRLKSRYELLSLITLYLGIFSLYNLLYGINFPIYIIMIILFLLVGILIFSILTLDKIRELIKKEFFNSFIVLFGLVIIEVFLCLYFWPISPELKSLVLVVIFYQMTTLVYLHSRSMLRLNKIVGHLIVNFIILVIIFADVWLQLPR